MSDLSSSFERGCCLDGFTDVGTTPSGSGLSPTVEPASSLDGSATSIPSAWSFCWTDGASLEDRALALVLSMAAVKCKNMYPKGVFGHEARAHYSEARCIAQAIETRSAETAGLSPQGESAVVEDHAPDVLDNRPHQYPNRHGTAVSGFVSFHSQIDTAGGAIQS